MVAAEKGHFQIVRNLIQHGADVNAVNNEGTSALMFAARFNHQELAKLLMQNGISTTLMDQDGKTAIDYMRVHSKVDSMQQLFNSSQS